jgi:hypothetical protein
MRARKYMYSLFLPVQTRKTNRLSEQEVGHQRGRDLFYTIFYSKISLIFNTFT